MINQKSVRKIATNLKTIWTKTSGKFTDYIAYEALRGAVMGIFDNFTAQDVYDTIQIYNNALSKDEPPKSLWEVDWGELEQFRYEFKLLAKDSRYAKYIDKVNAENILSHLARKKGGRVDLAGIIINTPNGVEWLSWEINNFLDGLMSDE